MSLRFGSLFKKGKNPLEISLPAQPYYPGQIVSGLIYYTPPKKLIEATSIRIHLRQTESFSWKEEDNSKKQKGKSTFFDVFQLVWGDGIHKRTLPSSSQEFPFSIQIPLDARPTFSEKLRKGKLNIRCELSAFIEAGAVVKDKNKVFLILNILASYPPSRDVIKIAKVEENIGGLLQKKKPLNISIKIEQPVVPTNTDALVDVEITNTSKKKVKALEMILYKSFTMRSIGISKELQHVQYCYAKQFPEVGDLFMPSESSFADRLSFPIRGDLPTSDFQATCINLNYFIKFRILCGGKRIFLQLPITVCSPPPLTPSQQHDVVPLPPNLFSGIIPNYPQPPHYAPPAYSPDICSSSASEPPYDPQPPFDSPSNPRPPPAEPPQAPMIEREAPQAPMIEREPPQAPMALMAERDFPERHVEVPSDPNVNLSRLSLNAEDFPSAPVEPLYPQLPEAPPDSAYPMLYHS